jgi:ribosomal protein L40E
MKEGALLLSLGIGALLFFQLKHRGYSPFLAVGVVLLGLVLPILILPIYLVLQFLPARKPVSSARSSFQKRPTLESSNICSKCGAENPSNALECRECHNQLKLG